MKLTVLVDNNTFIDQYYLGEPALSFFIEDGDVRVLFDAGYSDAFVQNAEKLGVDLRTLTHIVLSHGHDDHTCGLPALFALGEYNKVPLIAHPDCFWPKRRGKLAIGMPYSTQALDKRVDLQLTREPLRISERLTFLGEIPRLQPFEASYAMGERFCNGVWEPDFISEDSALVYESEEGLFIITGCSHSGICNIVAQAQKVTGDTRVLGIIGGFHLLEEGERLDATVDFLAALHMPRAYPCHCVSLHAKAKMLARFPIAEVGVGMQIEII